MPRLRALPLALLASVGAFAADEDPPAEKPALFADTIAPFFAPFTTDRAALAPDGKHVAYTLRRGTTAYVIIMNVDRPGVKLPVAIGDDRARGKTFEGVIKADTDDLPEDGPTFLADEKTPASIPFMVWPSGSRLVISNDVPELVAIDADGQHPGKLVDPDDVNVMKPSAASANPEAPSRSSPFVRRPPKILEVIPGDPDHIIVAAEGNVPAARPVPPQLAVGVFRANVHTGKLKWLHDTYLRPDSKILYDKDGRPRLSFWPRERRQSFDYAGIDTRGGDFAKFAGPEIGPSLVISPENYFAERSFPIAFDYDPHIAYLASNVGRDTFGLYAFDLRTKKRTPIGPENLRFDLAGPDSALTAPQLVFDRFQKKLVGIRTLGVTPATHWLDAELAQMQRNLDAAFPNRFAQILEWDEARARFLVRVSSCSDPGRYVIYFRQDRRALEFVRSVPGLNIDDVSATKPFEFDTAAGVHLSGYLTQPSNARISPPPLLIYCPDPLLGRALPAYDRDVQALAAMGLVVAQLNYRGASGFGRAHREALTAGLPTGVDRAPIDDIVSAVEWIAARQPIDRKRVALFGLGYGGTIALRALALQPERFRCAVTIDAPIDLVPWLNYSDVKQMADDAASFGSGPSAPASGIALDSGLLPVGMLPPAVDFPGELRHLIFGRNFTQLRELSPLRQSELIGKPVLLIQDRGSPDVPPDQAGKMRDALVKRGVPADFLEVGAEFTQRLPKASVAAFSKIEEFINLNLYDYGVKVGTPREK